MSSSKHLPTLAGRLKSRIRRIVTSGSLHEGGRAPTALPASRRKPGKEPQYKRFLTDNPVAYRAAIEAAETYASKLVDGEHAWLFAKPYDDTPGNPQYFRLMYDVLNILQAMRLPANARILEVGSGPGWVTEILLMMGFSVDALEPSSDLIDIARHRCTALKHHYHLRGEPKVRFHQDTLETIDFPEQGFDAILYFDVLHHVVDERVCIEKSFRFLKTGGCVGIIDPSWHPDFKPLEKHMMEEMAKFGTLENPFSTEYIDRLLLDAGFVDIERYISVNGMFSAGQSMRPLQEFSDRPMAGSNNMTARRPHSDGVAWPSCASPYFTSDARITLLSGGIDAARGAAAMTVKVENTGQTLLENKPGDSGHITFALRRNAPGAPDFIECGGRVALPRNLTPGQSTEAVVQFTLPEDAGFQGWELDMVAESLFWFSTRGMPGCPVPVR
ncbi:MAG: class I SAM-dependent methyltransferase [Pseudomonadales bacterium]|nr:class I SAM-dependent methyltransferase [Halioglobus sp.]MCP5122555.1 class I SAM-dependent methyltransferase [Pseudomonadales bacterium]MCP5191722.1 class I SAM-dependent methyltransferase [Pseudomonadales bacterium]